MAEQASLEYADKNGLNVVTLCPSFVFGPLLHPTVNTSSKFLIYVIKGSVVDASCPLLLGLPLLECFPIDCNLKY
jgi:nucleoside-diphosphate-sugar epimerase